MRSPSISVAPAIIWCCADDPAASRMNTAEFVYLSSSVEDGGKLGYAIRRLRAMPVCRSLLQYDLKAYVSIGQRWPLRQEKKRRTDENGKCRA